MSTGPTTQAASYQGKQSTVEHDDSHSALFYLFQEVSKLASPAHRGPLDTDQPSTRLSETCKTDSLVMKEEDAASLDGSCQHSLSHMSLYGQLKKAEEEAHSRSLVESQRECKSPWKVLSLINLHCERLLHQRDSLSASKSTSTAEISQPAPTSSAAGLTEEAGDRVQSSLKRSPLLKVIAEGDVMQACTGAGYRPQSCEVEPEILKDDAQQDGSCSEQDTEDTAISAAPAHIPSVTLNPTDEDSLLLSKPALTLDHNANITLSAELVQLPPPHSVPPSSQSADSCHLSSEQADKITPTEPGSPTEAAQLNPSSCHASSTTSEPEVLTEHKEETDVVPTRRRRAKTPRKQACPSRSVDIQDPDFQGVTFRMDRELDDNKEQCRLLITSKYSKELCKRRPRPRTRQTQNSLRTSSSEEDNDLTVNVLKGKVCASCCTRKTPMWRDAEDGTPLCNACGIRYKKYRVRCVSCWHIPRKEGNSNSCCLKCGNFVRMTSAQRKHTT